MQIHLKPNWILPKFKSVISQDVIDWARNIVKKENQSEVGIFIIQPLWSEVSKNYVRRGKIKVL